MAGTAPDFSLALTALLLGGGAVAGDAGEPGRQADAAPGKILPEALLASGEAAPEAKDAKDVKDEAEAAADMPFAWFAVAPIRIEPQPLPQGGAAAPGARIELRPALGAQPRPQGEATAPQLPVADAAAPQPQLEPKAEPAAKPVAIPVPGMQPVQVRPATAAMAPAADITRPVTIAQLQPRIETVQSATATAVVAAAFQLPENRPANQRRAEPQDLPILASAAPGTEQAAPQAVQAMQPAQDLQLDIRRRDWMTSMVDRIEAMRDLQAASAKETQIRLVPDALGKVDIAIRREGDRIDVRFTTETAIARTILNDAQPRLAELAEARGLRLGQASVSLGADPGASGGQGNQSRQDSRPAPAAPPSAFRDASADAPAEDRIA
ncbi:flagellar hook-length control protein FliK [Sphingomonas sp.]|uniref:flagellar hook-length control protein FliK n=1 Tax=Sphingomonas sp. TaxID=28214 RepID=UPI001B1BE3FC|nr:flagellar hook-length control protein FliK [Sphingomonas sp.]MBO9713932.1 flagellar hook-length control protein FliK [Sphingomonas sp.]